MEKYNLKPCPFCSNSAELLDCGKEYYVCCKECGCLTRGGIKEIQVKIWNTRAQTLDDVQKLKNERGAGRKPKVSNFDKQMIVDSIKRGSSYRSTANCFKVSVGTVHKIISEQKKKAV